MSIAKKITGGSLIDKTNILESASGTVIVRQPDNRLRKYKCNMSAEDAYCQLVRMHQSAIGAQHADLKLIPEQQGQMLVELDTIRGNRSGTQLMRCFLGLNSDNAYCGEPERINSSLISWDALSDQLAKKK